VNAGRPVIAGKTRVCPHCKRTILDSADICPGCHHHLRFGKMVGKPRASTSALSVEGSFRHSTNAEPCEYCVVIVIRNEHGEELERQVVGVGALEPEELRSFQVSVEVFEPPELVPVAPKRN
jgi:hypothetical protein